jgi:methanethiol S-methyltransferase
MQLMTWTRRARAGGVLAVTTLGALAFAASLVATMVVYMRQFGEPQPPWSPAAGFSAVATNLFWFSLFAWHHSVFARPHVKAYVTRVLTPVLERSVYVWIASVLLGLVLWQWAPVPGLAWQVGGVAAALLMGLQLGGVALTLGASRQLGVLQLAGLRPAAARPSAPLVLERTGLYGFVRHPIYFAWILMVWPSPQMTGSRLTFAILTTVYLAIAVRFEERSLSEQFGDAYRDYQRTVRWRMLPGVY